MRGDTDRTDRMAHGGTLETWRGVVRCAAWLLCSGAAVLSGCSSTLHQHPPTVATDGNRASRGRPPHATPAAPTESTTVFSFSINDQVLPSPADYGRYTTPGSCREAVLTTATLVWRTAQRDTLPYAPERDTLPTAAVTAARLCGKRFSIQQTEPRELRNLMDLALMMGDDEEARGIVQRQLSLVTGEGAQGDILEGAVESYLAAQPMRLAAAEATLAQLDALGRAARVPRLLAHASMQRQAEQRFDPARLRRECDAITTVDRLLTPDERDTWAPQLLDTYQGRIMLAWYDHPKGVLDIMREEQHEAATLRGGQLHTNSTTVLATTEQYMSMIGQPTPPLRATYWYNTGTDTLRPAPGKVSLFVQVDQSCGDGCYPLYAMIRRLARKYAAAGLEITLMAQTQGSFRIEGLLWPLGVVSGRTAVMAPQQEADAMRHYFLEALHLPVALAVAETPHRQAADGRRINEPVPYQRAYLGTRYVLTGRDGTLQMLTWSASEAMLDAFIKRAIGR